MISVVVPSLNSGPHLGQALASALGQEGVELEVVVQDGGSTDRTPEILANCPDPRLRVQSRPDGGQSSAFNRAIDRSRGDWIVWLNADDLLAPGALRLALDAATPSCDVVIGDFFTVDEDGAVLRSHRAGPLDRRRLLRRGCYAFSGATMIRRRVFEAHGGLRDRLHFAMDYEFFLRIAPAVQTVHLAQELACYRVHPGSKSSLRPWCMFREAGAVRRLYTARDGDSARSLLGQVELGLYYLSRRIWLSDRWLARRRAGRARTA